VLSNEILGLFAVVLGLLCYMPYYYDIFRHRTKPHIFTWALWGLLSGIAFVAQITEQAGPGAWITAATSINCFVIAALAFKRGEKKITFSDWAAFGTAFAAVGLWYFTNNPLYAVVLVVMIDALAFFPTYRKSWLKPHEETGKTYILGAAGDILALLALERYSATTVLYPAFMITIDTVFVAMLLWRRWALSKVIVP